MLHNSEDESRRIMDGYSERFDWVSVISVNDDSKRRRGGQIASLVNKGLELCGKDWDFFSKIDADMVLPKITSRLFLTNSNLLLNSELPAAPVTLWTEGGKDRKRYLQITPEGSENLQETMLRRNRGNNGIRRLGWD